MIEAKAITIGEQIELLKLAYEGEKFMGTPDEWYEPCHWWCDNGHRSRRYLKSERLGYNACLAGGCGMPVYLGPREIPGRDPK
jgi:hypothetical protein